MTGPWMVAFIMVCVVLVALTTIVLGLLRRFNAALEKVELQLQFAQGPSAVGLHPGSTVPALNGFDRLGRPERVDEPGRRKTVLLLAPGCLPCEGLLDDLKLRAETAVTREEVVVVMPAGDESTGWDMEASGYTTVYQVNGAISNALQCTVSPAMFVLGADGTIEIARIPGTIEEVAHTTSDDHATADH